MKAKMISSRSSKKPAKAFQYGNDFDVWVDTNETFTPGKMPKPVATFRAASPEEAARIAASDGAFDPWFAREHYAPEIDLLVRRKGGRNFWSFKVIAVTKYEVVSALVMPPEHLT